MRTYRSLILFVALVCTGIACKKEGSSLKASNEKLSVTAEQTQIETQFKNATGLSIVNQVPFNADSRIEFATVQEAANYFNALKNTTIPIEDPNAFPSLPAPDDQGCVGCKVVTFICTMPFHFSVLTGRIYFSKDPYSPQYNYVTDTWQLYGAHFGLNTSRPIVISMNGYTKFNFTKQVEYYVGIRIGGFDVTFSWWYRIVGNGDVNNPNGAGYLIPF
jgi:hypothetical protein